MMELYALFRDTIAFGQVADVNAKSSKIYSMALKLNEAN